MRIRLFAATCSLALLSSATALATPVAYQFAGTTSWADVTGSYTHNFGVPSLVEFSGRLTLESDTLPYYEEATQRWYSDLVTSFSVQLGTDGEYGTYIGPSGLQRPAPWGWNSSSACICTGSYYAGSGWEEVAIYGSVQGPPIAAENVYLRFALWGVSGPGVFDGLPPLDNLPNRDAWGPLPMGFSLTAAQYDDEGNWLGQTTLNANISSFDRVPVAEPAAWGTLLAGLVAAPLLGRRRPQRFAAG